VRLIGGAARRAKLKRADRRRLKQVAVSGDRATLVAKLETLSASRE